MTARGLLLVALGALALALLLLFLGVPRYVLRPPPGATEPTPVATAPPIPQPHFGEVCAPHQQRICDGGDAWWQDSCGRREERAQACDGSCLGGHCLAPSPGAMCPGLSEGGRCDGEVLRWCDNGRARSYDCTRIAAHCARGSDGEPNCVPAEACSEDKCRRGRADLCEGGFRNTVFCGFGEVCELDAHRRARCVRRVSDQWIAEAACHGCACPSPSPEDELPPIPVVAFLVSDGSGHAAGTEERARLDVELLDHWFRRAGLRFALRDVRKLVRPNWLSANGLTVNAARVDEELHPRDQPFFVPVVFVNDLHIGVKTASGVGTFPGHSCAELAPLPPTLEDEGVIFVARLRSLTTLAHEMGHYFGLCHTHQADPAPPHVVLRSDGTPLECGPCGQAGDGVCDTPVDPGLEDCSFDEDHCTASCPSGAAPDPTNLMSYFIPCRRLFTDQQAAYLRRYARLRLRSR